MIKGLYISFLVLCTLQVLAAKDVWYGGGFAFVERSEQTSFKDIKTGNSNDSEVALPFYSGGLIELSGDSGARARFVASNRAEFEFHGSGKVAVERFEERYNGGRTNPDSQFQQTQMILSLRAGTLLVDSREFNSSSLLVVETPIGRVTVTAALWLIDLKYNVRNQNYNLEVECIEGQLRLVDTRGQVFQLPSGRRLSGVGSAANIMFEISDFTEESVETFEAFAAKEDVFSEAKLQSQLIPLRTLSTSERQPVFSEGAATDQSRPVVIEYAPNLEDTTPFRGQLKPVGARQVDLF